MNTQLTNPYGATATMDPLVFAADGRVLTVHSGELWSMRPDGTDRQVLDETFPGSGLSGSPVVSGGSLPTTG
jgi:hypothetical protein